MLRGAFIVPVRHPFPDVPCPGIDTVGTLLTGRVADRGGLAITVMRDRVVPPAWTVRLADMQPCPRALLAPGRAAPIGPPGGLFPRRLRGAAWPRPGAVGVDVSLAPLDHRGLRHRGTVTAWPQRRPPGGPGDRPPRLPRIGPSPGLTLGLGAVACRGHPLGAVRVRPCLLSHIKGV